MSDEDEKTPTTLDLRMFHLRFVDTGAVLSLVDHDWNEIRVELNGGDLAKLAAEAVGCLAAREANR